MCVTNPTNPLFFSLLLFFIFSTHFSTPHSFAFLISYVYSKFMPFCKSGSTLGQLKCYSVYFYLFSFYYYTHHISVHLKAIPHIKRILNGYIYPSLRMRACARVLHVFGYNFIHSFRFKLDLYICWQNVKNQTLCDPLHSLSMHPMHSQSTECAKRERKNERMKEPAKQITAEKYHI